MRTLLLAITLLAAAPAKHGKATPAPAATPMGDAGKFAQEKQAGKDAEAKMDWVAARSAWREAVAAAPSAADQTAAKTSLDRATTECSKSAKHFISETKAYLAADNCPEAKESLAKAEPFLDGDADPLSAQLQEMKSDMSRSCAGN